MAQEWYVQTSSGKAGPFASAKLRQLAQSGKIAPESLVSLDGENWSPASRVKGLAFADMPPAQGPSQPPPADEYALAEDNRSEPTVDRPSARASSTYPSANVIPLDESPAHFDDASPRLSTTAGLPARFGVSFILAAVAAVAVRLLVRLTVIFGVVDLNTTATSLAARVGLPALAFVVVFASIFWLCGGDVEPPKITADMTDEEIADALRRH